MSWQELSQQLQDSQSLVEANQQNNVQDVISLLVGMWLEHFKAFLVDDAIDANDVYYYKSHIPYPTLEAAGGQFYEYHEQH
ncbi:hypothetical protein ACM26V_04175 [Salipaludibacillus sp. HK11]|uniref:hypothetical protein n=1 Tax=Salipaludibacillus sp. HK11 TaxID=3394320 RepID=UPI0039FD0A5C